ncbi:MAG TPA: hypothetical protein PLF32_02580 [Bacteroidales bacterium]|nr:hypothetical protein [Bacteroidales bacterium]HON19961.1 hypothetical protein [Bacteroidales bacterium]HOR81524.1 hypothetical protein [Bacteroidales bacterium]HPJ90398.1 hypothetical protein [Bacteroidales bacterium]HQB19737.1 hypothetical protein [Bacteroidales bacterium]
MKKLSLCFLFLFFLFSLTAQEKTLLTSKNYFEHEAGISVGAFPMIGFFYYYRAPFMEPNPMYIKVLSHYSYIDKEDGQYFKAYLIGTFLLEYKYNFTSRHAIGMTTSWACRKIIDSNWVRTDVYIDNYFAPQIGYYLTYKRFEKLSLYSAIHFGVTFYYEDIHMTGIKKRNFWALPSMYLTFLGISVGNKNAGNFEFGFGTQGVIKAGYRYKFGK